MIDRNRKALAAVFAALSAASAALAQAVCAECHAAIAESYARTGMGRSFRSAGTFAMPEFDGGSFDHAKSGQRFTAFRRDDKYSVRRSRTGPDGKETEILEAQVDYVLGSGNHARSYLRRTADGKLIEFPVSWYAENGGYWGMSPGYDRPGHAGFSREVTYRCMFCHNGYPEVPDAAAKWDRGTEFPARLPEGIDCQRCHGPGSKHVEIARKGGPAQSIRAAIVHPARLTPERRLEICMQCHLESTSSPLPGSLMRFGSGVFSYRAGEPLGNYMLYFDHAPGTGHDEKFEIVGAAYRFRKSACFQRSNGRLDCTSCHNPHEPASRDQAQRQTRAVCQGCHNTLRRGHSTDSNCVACHMPRRRAEDVPDVFVTDHRIVRRPANEGKPVDPASPPYAGEVVLYYPPEQGLDLYLAIAQVKDLANIPLGFARLQAELTRLRPAEARPYYELAQSLLTASQVKRALPFFEEAARRDPGERRYRYSLAQSDQRSENADSLAQLGNALLRTGDIAGAERALTEAVRLRPEAPAIRMNLGAALVRSGKQSAAVYHFEEALRAGPVIETARSAWFAALAETGSVSRARARYDASLRAQLAPAHVNMGTALALSGDHQGAIVQFRLAIEADPESASARTNLALALAALERARELQRH